MLLREMAKCVPLEDERYAPLDEAVKSVKQIATAMHTQMAEKEMREKVTDLSAEWGVAFTSPARIFKKEGRLTKARQLCLTTPYHSYLCHLHSQAMKFAAFARENRPTIKGGSTLMFFCCSMTYLCSGSKPIDVFCVKFIRINRLARVHWLVIPSRCTFAQGTDCFWKGEIKVPNAIPGFVVECRVPG